jgi:hypothetical protein
MNDHLDFDKCSHDCLIDSMIQIRGTGLSTLERYSEVEI